MARDEIQKKATTKQPLNIPEGELKADTVREARKDVNFKGKERWCEGTGCYSKEIKENRRKERKNEEKSTNLGHHWIDLETGK